MSETSTSENEDAVARVYALAITARVNGLSISPEQRVVHDVEHLMQEANSGASYEQYFRWASMDEIGSILGHLRGLGLDNLSNVTERAIHVAFPNGLPSGDDEKNALTDWSEDQDEALSALFEELEDENGHVMNVLGAFAIRVGA